MNISKTYSLAFPIETVYSAWISSSTVIPPATSMDILPVVGGHYRLIMQTPNFTSRNEGEFLVVETNSHVKYTWEWDKNGEVTEIDVRFKPQGSGTQILIEHTGFHSAETANMHASGWDSYIEGLSAFLAN